MKALEAEMDTYESPAYLRNAYAAAAKPVSAAEHAANQARAQAARARVFARAAATACPPGQTYDRTLKACRDKKKPGRPAAGAGKSRRRRNTRRRN